MSYVHCDGCEKEAPPFVQLSDLGWWASYEKSVSGIPMDLYCPDCLRAGRHINVETERMERKREHDERLRANF